MHAFKQCFILLALSMMSNAVCSQEIAPFRVTGTEGYVDLRYYGDEYSSTSTTGQKTYRNGAMFEQELYGLVHSYIYHPNLIRLDVGGGPVFFQNNFDSNQDSSNFSDYFWNFDAEMNLLEKKPYPLRLFYDRRHSTTSPIAQDRFILRRTRYGLDFSLREPLIPADSNLYVRRNTVNGLGASRVIDERIDQATFSVRGDLGARGYGNFTYNWSDEKSASGSTALPIVPTNSVTHSLDLFTHHLFGSNDQIRFLNQLTFDDRSYEDGSRIPSSREIHFFPQLDWTHSDTLKTWYRYDYFNRDQEITDTTINRAYAGVTHYAFDRRLETLGNIHGESNDTTGFKEDIYGTRLSLSWRQPFNSAFLGLSASWSYDHFDRQASSATATVIGESHVLVDAVPVPLDNLFVVAESIRVSNAPRTQVYVEGSDYRVIVIGDVTEIQRIPSGNIEDGAPVLVDYQYRTGGTVSFNNLAQSYRIDLSFLDHFRVYAQYRSNNQTLESGFPTLPLNSFSDKLVGAAVEYPLWDSYKIGGDLEAQDYDADVSPYTSRRGGIFFEMPTPLRGRLRFFGSRRVTDRLRSTEDVNLKRYGVRFFGQPWDRTSVNADWVHEDDDGGSVPRSYERGLLRFNWRYRKVRFSLLASYNFNQLGDTDTDSNRVEASLARDF